MKLSAQTSEKLYRIDRAIGKVMKVSAALWFVLVFALLYKPLQKYFVPAMFITLAVCVVCIFCRIILSPFVKSEEAEEFEQFVKECVQETLQQQEKKSSQTALQTDYSPLRNLTAEQEQKVRDLLCNLPSHANKADAINMALNAQYLTALAQSDKADLQNKKCLRLWVEQLSGKTAPEQRQFNEAFDNVSMQKVAKARKDIERIIGSNLADNPSVGDSNTAN